MALIAIDSVAVKVRALHDVSPVLLLWTDEKRLTALPPPLRQAVDQILVEDMGAPPPATTMGVVRWRTGERWLEGHAATLRHALAVPSRRSFVPVHWPGWDDLDLIGLEPRWWSATHGAPLEDCIHPSIRIGAAPVPASGRAPVGGELWEQLSEVLARSVAQPEVGVGLMATLAQRRDGHPLLCALVLRNLVVLLLKDRNWTAASDVVTQAGQLFPSYRELNYLAARCALAAGRAGEIAGHLQRATGPGDGVWIGSGGESGYRAHYLWALLAEQCGRQAMAFQHFLSGVRRVPAFAPSVAGLLRQRLPSDLFSVARLELGRLARRQSEWQVPIFDFFLQHRAWDAAELALRAWPLDAQRHGHLESRWNECAALRRATPRPPAAPVGLLLSGPLHVLSSVARINRYIARGLVGDAGFDLALEPTVAAQVASSELPGGLDWEARLRRTPARIDVTLRHGWPPDFSRPATGRLALILPWEFGSIPVRWVAPLHSIDRVLVPSEFVRGVFRRAGIDRVHVVPNGVDLELYRQEGEVYRHQKARTVTFLFAGGAIRRKGLDLLLRAWRDAFTAADDVALIIKDFGAQSFYRHLNLRSDITALAADPGAAPVVHLDEDWSEQRMPALYRGADVLVLPYRGEGFGLPLIEAMACGKPVITTAAGPAPEFCPPDAGWLVEAEECEMPADLRPTGRMTGPATWFEPSLEALTGALRAAAADGADRRRRGARAAEHTRAEYGWQRIVAAYRRHLQEMVEAHP